MIENFAMPVYDVCVIGAGPAGIVASLELADAGLSVVLVESGIEGFNSCAQRLSDAVVTTPLSQSVMVDAVRRGLGGTSVLWGGRCVPLDEIDFEQRDFVPDSGWPLKESDILPFYQRACEFLGVVNADFNVNSCAHLANAAQQLSANFKDSDNMSAVNLERWCREPNAWVTHKHTIQTNSRITVLSNFTCVGFFQASLNGAVSEAVVRSTGPDQANLLNIKAKVFVIACGGIESTRLVLNSMDNCLGLKLTSATLVGRYYMGHPSGKIADISLSGDPKKTIYGFERDSDVYVRRRITFSPRILRENSLLNIAFWLDNAPLADWRHGNGVLSAAYLALTLPFISGFLAPAAIRKRMLGSRGIEITHHVWNCLRQPLKTVAFCLKFFYQRYMSKPRVPGFFTFSENNIYALHYHAEQVPNCNSTITLADEVDSHGLRKARIALRWSYQDIDSIIRSHSVLDAELQETGAGRLIYRYPVETLREIIHDQAMDGYHQIGTLRMGTDPSTGVTDSFGMIFGTSNCYVASSAVFPTSGQANPTLSIVALAIRQAKHIIAVTTFQQKAAHA